MTILFLIYCKLLFDREEAAEMLGICVRKLDELVVRGELKPRRIDHAIRFYVGELVRFASIDLSELNGRENNAEGANDHEA